MYSLILPAYNPGPAVAETWRAVARFVTDQSAAGSEWEAVFVLDGCTDGTDERLAALAAGAGPRMRVLGYTKNRGKGYAVRAGLLAARGAYRVFTDVDLAYSFDDVNRLADALRAGAAVAIASREHPDSRVQIPPSLLSFTLRRRLQSRLFGAAVRRLLPLPHRDTQAGLKGMSAAVAEHVVPELRCDGFGVRLRIADRVRACRSCGDRDAGVRAVHRPGEYHRRRRRFAHAPRGVANPPRLADPRPPAGTRLLPARKAG